MVAVCGEYLSGRASRAANPDNYQVITHVGTGTLAGAHTAWPWRSHVEDGGHVDPATVQMIACNSTISAMLHDENGNLLNVGHRHPLGQRRGNGAGQSRQPMPPVPHDCPRHRRDHRPRERVVRLLPGRGQPGPPRPGLPGGTVDGLKASHDAELEWHTIIPPRSGERLDLHGAIWICLHNLKLQAQRREQNQQDQQRRQAEFTPAM